MRAGYLAFFSIFLFTAKQGDLGSHDKLKEDTPSKSTHYFGFKETIHSHLHVNIH
jgi:hypothetical protein